MNTPTPTPKRGPRPGSGTIERLKPERIQDGLRALTGWRLDESGTSISRRFRFPSARPAASFSQLVADLALDHLHQPAIHLYGNQVDVTLTTALARGLTARDLKLARAINLVP